MITKTIALMLTMSMTFFTDSTSLPLTVQIDIDFCSLLSGENETICTIRESENGSRNKIILEKKGGDAKIFIDKRNMLPEKALYVFQNNTITIQKRNVVDLPHLETSILIRPGIYDVVVSNRGYTILLSDRIPIPEKRDLAAAR